MESVIFNTNHLVTAYARQCWYFPWLIGQRLINYSACIVHCVFYQFIKSIKRVWQWSHSNKAWIIALQDIFVLSSLDVIIHNMQSICSTNNA